MTADEQTAASEHCEDCGTDQCSSCAKSLHLDSNLESHSRVSLETSVLSVVCTQPTSLVTPTTASSEEEEQWQDCSTEDFTDSLADNRSNQKKEEDYDTVARKRAQRAAPSRSSDNNNIPIPITSNIPSGDKKHNQLLLEAGAVNNLLLEPTGNYQNININDTKDQNEQIACDSQQSRKVDKDQDKKKEATVKISLVVSSGGSGSPQAEDSLNAKLNTPGDFSLVGGGGVGGKKKKRPTSGAIGGGKQSATGNRVAGVDELFANNSDDPSDAGAADLFGTVTSVDGAGSSSSDDSSGNSNSEGYVSSGSRQKTLADNNIVNVSNNNMANNALSNSCATTQPMDIEANGTNANKKKKSKKVIKGTNVAENGNSTSSCASSVSPSTSPPAMMILPTKKANTQSPLINIDVESDMPNIAKLSLENTSIHKIGGGRVYNKSGTKKVADKSKRIMHHQQPGSKNSLLDENIDNDDEDLDEDDEPKEDDDQEEEADADDDDDDELPGMTDIDLGGGGNSNYKYRSTSTATNFKSNCAGSAASYQDQNESFLLVNEEEMLQVKSAEEFIAKLGCGCDERTLVKVVSIFGNTGEGKSHTLNYTFYDCHEMFGTSPTQNSCTIGIWCAYDPTRRVITIDTEGLLGMSENNNRRTRLLLKVLAISDVIIYRTRAERLHTDLFTFLGTASSAYIKHFAKELKAASERCNLQCTISDLGPVVIIFHETVHTEVLHKGM